jgi:glycosyltransferase involved in cell wall biosynthesis
MCGTPVIANARGSMPEIIMDGKTGYLVNDVTEAVAAVKKLKNISHHKCREHACLHFSMDRMIDEYIQAYEIAMQGIGG